MRFEELKYNCTQTEFEANLNDTGQLRVMM
jgi:hypothetical protein